MDDTITIRPANASDYDAVIAHIDEWWERPIAQRVPRLFFSHFAGTVFVAERAGEILGFICGFLSQSYHEEAYVHFVTVDQRVRGRGIARALYDIFFTAVQSQGRTIVRCVVSADNAASIAFHEALGFVAEPEIVKDYDGAGIDRVLFFKRLD